MSARVHSAAIRNSGTNSAFYKMVITPEIAIAVPWTPSALHPSILQISSSGKPVTLSDISCHWASSTSYVLLGDSQSVASVGEVAFVAS